MLLIGAIPTGLRAIEARELLLTVQGAYVHPLSPSGYLDSYSGSGFHASFEKVLDNKNSIGLMVSDVGFRDSSNASANANAASLDVIGRHFWQSVGWLNPYLMLGIGGDLYAPAIQNPFGDFFHIQTAVGSLYVINSFWAVDYAVAYHLLAPITQPYSYGEFRLGLNYRFGGQARVNANAAPKYEAQAVETIPDAAVDRIIGHFTYEVRLGDSLAKIARLKLGNEQLWPLLAAENAATVKDPQLILPRQRLEIRHHYDDDKKKAAIRKAWLVPTPTPRNLSTTTQASK